jgi:hypothetical protein
MGDLDAARHPSRPMNELSVAEIMPVLYRGVLDSVADLEARNERREAARIRAEATRVYSRAWNLDAARRLRALCERASRAAAAPGLRRSRYLAVLEAFGRRPETSTDLGHKPA